MTRSAAYVPPTAVRPPKRADYLGAKSRVELLGTPEPPKYLNYTPSDSPGSAPRQMSNRAYGAWVSAQASAAVDRQLVADYEGFADRYADLHADVSERVAAGKASQDDEAFAGRYEAHVAEKGSAPASA